MQLGSLHITLPDSRTREFVVEQATMGVGRDPNNELVIDDPSIARRHARLTFEDGRLIVEDLGSSHGTFFGLQRLEANTPSLVPADEPLRLGDVVIAYHPSAGQAAAHNFSEQVRAAPLMAASAIQPAGPPVTVTLVGPDQPVVPGSATTASLTLQNHGTVVDEFVIHVSGIPAEWVQLRKDRVPLLPGAQEEVTVSFLVPQQTGAVAAEHPFTITVMSREHRTGTNAQGVLKLLPHQGLALGLRPVRGARDFTLVASNQGGEPVSLSFAGGDDERSLLYSFAQPTVTLPPGENLEVGLTVTPRVAPRIGTRETRAFSIAAQPVSPSSGPDVQATGQLIIRPPIPIWLVPLAVILTLCLCIASAYGFVSFCPNYLPDAPFCPAGTRPVINVFTATPTEVDTGSTVVVAWDVSNADRVEFLTPAPETLEASGLRTFRLDANTTFTLRATNVAGSVEQTLFVLVRGSSPTVESFTATPGVISAGETGQIVLSWTTINADAVTIEGVPGPTFPATGSVEVPAPSANTTYTLIASNTAGSARQPLTVVVSQVECRVVNVVAPDQLNLRAGPAGGFPVVIRLENGTRVDPLGRNATGDWLKLRAAGREGWANANFVTCAGPELLNVLPTVEPALVPTLAP